MRVALDAAALGSGRGGDETLLRGYLSGLVHAAGDDDRFRVYIPEDTEPPEDAAGDPRFEWRGVPRQGGAHRLAWTLPARLRADRPRPDVLLAFNHAPLSRVVPTVLVVTDLSFRHHPEHYPRATRLRLSQLVPRQARRSDLVVTISGFCRQDLLDSYGLPVDRVAVVPCAIAVPPAVDATRWSAARTRLDRRGVRDPFVLYLGNLHPRKNVVRLLDAFARAVERGELAGHQLVVAGARWWGTGEEEAAGRIPDDRVRLLGPVDDDEREVLLRSAAALAYPSVFEGFGLPPLEAMARGTPVLTSTVTSLPEVCGDAAVLVDPLDVGQIAAGLVEVTTEGPARDQRVRRGIDRAAGYSVARTGRALHRALRSVSAAHGPVPDTAGPP